MLQKNAQMPREVLLPGLGLLLIETPDGMTVAALERDGKAALSGKVNIGDYILAINDIGIDDKEVHEIEQLSESVDHKGQCTVWVVKPDGSEIFVTLKVQGSRSPSPALDEAVTDNVGVGISISAANGVPVVAALSPWGSARWSGKIAIGDEVVSVHGVPCSRLAPQQVIGLIEDCSENDGGLVKMAIRRKGPLSHSEPLLVLLAREKKSKADGQSSQYPPQETGSRDLMDIKARPAPMHTSPIEHGQFLQDQGANRETTLPHAVAKLSDQSLNTPSNILVSQNGRQLGPALHQLLSYLKAPDGSEVHPLGAFDEAASSEDMKILHLVKDEAVEQKTKLKNALELVELSKENMEKRKQHIITLSAQLKQAEEKRHRDLKSNNEWMRLEMQKQNESVEAEKARLQADMQEQTRKLEDQLNEKYSQQLKQVELSVEEIQREADTKEKYLKDLNRQQQHLEDENASLRAENLAFKDRVAQLVRQLGERQREPAGERPDIVRLERENAELRSQFEHERAELKSELQAALMATRGVTTDSAGEAAQMKEKERKIEALDAVNKELQTQLAEKNEHCDRIEKMLSELEGKFKATESLAEVKMPVIEQQRQVPQVQRARPPSESPVEIEEPFIDVPLCAPSSDQESPPEEITTEESFVGGPAMWQKFIEKGAPVQGAPELFQFEGKVCNQPYYDENRICEIRNVETGELYYRGKGIHGPDHDQIASAPA